MFLYKVIFSAMMFCIPNNLLTSCTGASTSNHVRMSDFQNDLISKTDVEGQKDGSPRNHDLRKRAITSYQNCNSWSNWINRNNLNQTDKVDRERINTTDIQGFCPVNIGADVSKISCKDNKEEPFSGTITDTVNQFTVNCSNIKDGVSCAVFDTNSTYKCPDFSIRFYCNCSSFTWSTQAASPSILNYPTTTNANTVPSSKNTYTTYQPLVISNDTTDLGTQNPASRPDSTSSLLESNSLETLLTNDQEGKGGFFENKTVWLILFIVCVAMCLSNCILIVVLHKRAMKYAKDNRGHAKVEPFLRDL